MATSHDGYTFTAVNDGQPVIAGDTIAEQRGVRDPHIYRGFDGAFYLCMTDLHILPNAKNYAIPNGNVTKCNTDGEITGH